MKECGTFDSIWEEKYSKGHAQRYPWDIVVSFVYRYAPKNKDKRNCKILEVGCGTGSNLWFAAREGYKVCGIDASESAITYSKGRFKEDGLVGVFEVGDFTRLPFKNDEFDLVIDRGALTCAGKKSAGKSIEEIGRVILPDGHFIFTPYSKEHSGAGLGKKGSDGLVYDIFEGSLSGCGQICFYNKDEIEMAFMDDWEIVRCQHVEIKDVKSIDIETHAEWRVIVKRKSFEKSK